MELRRVARAMEGREFDEQFQVRSFVSGAEWSYRGRPKALCQDPLLSSLNAVAACLALGHYPCLIGVSKVRDEVVFAADVRWDSSKGWVEDLIKQGELYFQEKAKLPPEGESERRQAHVDSALAEIVDLGEGRIREKIYRLQQCGSPWLELCPSWWNCSLSQLKEMVEAISQTRLPNGASEGERQLWSELCRYKQAAEVFVLEWESIFKDCKLVYLAMPFSTFPTCQLDPRQCLSSGVVQKLGDDKLRVHWSNMKNQLFFLHPEMRTVEYAVNKGFKGTPILIGSSRSSCWMCHKTIELFRSYGYDFRISKTDMLFLPLWMLFQLQDKALHAEVRSRLVDVVEATCIKGIGKPFEPVLLDDICETDLDPDEDNRCCLTFFDECLIRATLHQLVPKRVSPEGVKLLEPEFHLNRQFPLLCTHDGANQAAAA